MMHCDIMNYLYLSWTGRELSIRNVVIITVLDCVVKAFELHAHAGDEHGHEDEGFRIEVEPYTYKSLIVIAGKCL